MTDDPLEREKMFQRWWKASKYCQVVYPEPHLEQYARDGFAAGLSAALSASRETDWGADVGKEVLP